MEVTFKQVKDKFFDKGYMFELYTFVLPPPPFVPGKFLGTLEHQKQCYKKAIKEVYSDHWEFWNTWIDYQQYK